MRIQRRRVFTARGGITDTCVRESETAPANTSLEHQEKSTSSFASASQFESLPPEDVNAALLQYPDDLFADDAFGLSLNNILFLDQVFMGDSGPAEWNSSQQITNQQGPSSTTGDGQSGTQEQHEQINTFSVETLDQSSWPGGSADSTTFTAALYSYFNFAAPYLPIILEDAFWQDYHAGRCSQALVYAIACRGVPFTAAINQWDLQQCLACKFREAFLEARSTASDDGMIRLDDLEALALMIDFEYEDAGSPPLHSSLGRLFLKHESLVLMTLQSRICDRSSTNSDSSAMLARAGERRVLLYWHVYGLDAFHCLDRKQISYIPDDDAGSTESLPQHEAKGYFDAILALAIIARKTIQNLCSAAVKRRGVEPNDVHILYELLYYWRNNSCPEHLRRHEDSAGKLVNMDPGGSNASALKKHTQLHRAVLWALEINCLLQIECCVSQYGIHDSRSLEAEATAIRVEYESVRALKDMIAICRWMKQHEIRDQDEKRHSLIDLAPSALRNICAGMCFWSCQRGIEFCRRAPPILLHFSSTRDRTSRRCAGIDNKKRHINTYIETAQLLRDAVATATSHHDTAHVLERLDKQRALLKTELGDIQAIHE
jgi:Fungal specific transcription factor domain